MEKQRKLNLHGQVQLGLEVLQLGFLRAEKQPVVVESNLAKRNNVAGFLAFQGKRLDFLEQLRRPTGVLVEVLGLTRVDANRGVAEARYSIMGQLGRLFPEDQWGKKIGTYGTFGRSPRHAGTLRGPSR